MNKNNNLDFTEAIQNGINDFGILWQGKNCTNIDSKVIDQRFPKRKFISNKLLLKILTVVKFQ